MDNVSQNYENTNKIQEETNAIKHDIKDLVERLRNVKDYSIDLLQGSVEDLLSAAKDLKHKALHQGAVAELYMSTRQHPARNLAYAFLAGIVVTMLCYKKK